MPAACAPIAVFAFNRPQHLQRTLQALAACPQAANSSLTLYCDGPRRPADDEAVAEVREVAHAARGFASVVVRASPRNQGLAASIIGGVGHQLTMADRVIVVEDDLVVSPHFLAYMNGGLALYADTPRVASIHGYCYPCDIALPETFFQRGADCWGWATWSRAWRHFEPDGAALLARLRAQRLTHAFDIDGSHPYTRMLEDQVAGRNNSWAIRWHAACYLADMLTLYPGRSLVQNIGNDASGTHCGSTDVFGGLPSTEPVHLQRIALQESAAARQAFKRFHRRSQGWRQRLRGMVSGLLATNP